MTKRLILGTAGHIDHGKTSLVRALTGVDADRLPEEKQRGMTIDLGFAELKLPNCTLGVVDVPGHERFIKNMLAGAAAIDVALLVVAADDAIMPQTREHLAILDLLGVANGVIAITKCDLRDSEWLELVKQEVSELLDGTALASAPIVFTAAPRNGEPSGVDELRAALADVAAMCEPEEDDELFRLCIDRVFSAPGRGTVVTGTVSSGELTAGRDVQLLPAQRQVTARALQSHDKATAKISRGCRAAVNLSDIHRREVKRGDVLATPEFLRPSKLLTVELSVLEFSAWAVKHRGRYTLHVGSQAVPASVYLFDDGSLSQGEATTVQLHAARPVAAVFGQPFVLRNETPVGTVGGGRVLQPCARPVRRSQTDCVERLRELSTCSQKRRVELAIYEYGVNQWNSADLRRDAGVQRRDAQALVDTLVEEQRLVRFDSGDLLHAEIVIGLKHGLANTVESLHGERPLSRWIPRPQIAKRLHNRISASLFDELVDQLVANNTLLRAKDKLKFAKFEPRLSLRQQNDLERIRVELSDGETQPPTAPELAEHLERKLNEVLPLLQLLVDSEDAVFIGPGLFLDANSTVRLRQTVRKALQAHGQLTIAEIRDLLGVSRKYAVPICEYLDRCGETVRVGDVRRLAAGAATDASTLAD